MTKQQVEERNKAFVVRVGRRYFKRFGKRGKNTVVLTTARLGDAALFVRADNVPGEKLVREGKTFKVYQVEIMPQEVTQ